MNQFKEKREARAALAPARHHRPMPRRLAAATLLLMAVVVLASAWLRLSTPRASCELWPLCRFEAAATDAAAAAPGDALTRAVRGAHRAAASAVLLLIVAMGVLAWRRRERAALRPLGAQLALALGLSLLGIATPGSRSAGVMLGNLLGGALMFGLAALWWRMLGAAAAMPAALRRGARALSLLWLAQAALGSLSGAGMGASAWATLAHLLLALLLVIAAFLLGLAAQRALRRREAHALWLLLALQVALGAGAALGGASTALVLAHNAVAALGLALLLGWAFGGGDAGT
jgi:heme A synthase